MSLKGLLYDQSRCIGCKACEQACQVEHGQPPHEATALNADSFNWVQQLPGGAYQRHLCMHCLTPTCVSVCPVAALRKTAEGPVVWEASLCMGCRYCMMACPFGIPKYEWHSVNPRIRKCDMCVHRVSKGLDTGCASICPTGATVFGEAEAGGTGVLMLLTRSAKENGLPTNVPKDALPQLTWKVLVKLPVIIPVWAIFLGGMYWLTERKNEIAHETRHDVMPGDTNEHE